MKDCMKLIARIIAVTSAVLMLGACQPIDAAFDCDTICTRYKNCFDGSYNVETCANRCRENAKVEKDYYRAVNTCEACINDRACASATFSCGSDCSKVVP